jgi:hypothetical protein
VIVLSATHLRRILAITLTIITRPAATGRSMAILRCRVLWNHRTKVVSSRFLTSVACTIVTPARRSRQHVSAERTTRRTARLRSPAITLFTVATPWKPIVATMMPQTHDISADSSSPLHLPRRGGITFSVRHLLKAPVTTHLAHPTLPTAVPWLLPSCPVALCESARHPHVRVSDD